MLEVSRDAVTAGEQQFVSCAAEQSKHALSVQSPLTLAEIYLSRVGVVGSVLEAALTQV